MKSEKAKAIFFILLSALGFSMMSVCVRLAGDLPFIQKSVFRNLVAVFVAFIALQREKIGFRWEKGNLPMLLARSICGTFGVFCNYYAIDHLVLADANILNKMSPFFVILFSVFLLKEKANLYQYAAVAAAFCGSLLIIKPGFSSDVFPAVIGLLGGIGAGAAYTAVRALGKQGEKSARIVFFFSAFSILVALPFLIFDFHPMTAYQVICLLGAGCAATLGQFGVTLAYAHAPAKEISVFDYSQVLFTAMFGFFIFDQTPDKVSVLGYVIICGVSVMTFLHNLSLDRKEKG